MDHRGTGRLPPSRERLIALAHDLISSALAGRARTVVPRVVLREPLDLLADRQDVAHHLQRRRPLQARADPHRWRAAIQRPRDVRELDRRRRGRRWLDRLHAHQAQPAIQVVLVVVVVKLEGRHSLPISPAVSCPRVSLVSRSLLLYRPQAPPACRTSPVAFLSCIPFPIP